MRSGAPYPGVPEAHRKQGMCFAKPDEEAYYTAFKDADIVHFYMPFRFCRRGEELARQMGIPTMICGQQRLPHPAEAGGLYPGGRLRDHPLPWLPGQHDRRHAPQGHGTAGGDHRPQRLPPGLHGPPPQHLTFGTINALALRRLDYRIGVSDAMVDLLISRGFPADRFYTIYNGIDFTPPPTQGDRLEYLRSLGADVDENSVVVASPPG